MTPAPKPPACVIDPEYRAFIAQCPCVACLTLGRRWFGCDVAHVRTRRNNGDRENLVALCHDHHLEQHRIGILTFQQRYGLNLGETARDLWKHYEAREELAF